MKKVFAILLVTGFLTACGNDAGSENKAEDPKKEVAPPEDSSSKMMHDPAHNMIPPDSTGTERMPRQ